MATTKPAGHTAVVVHSTPGTTSGGPIAITTDDVDVVARGLADGAVALAGTQRLIDHANVDQAFGPSGQDIRTQYDTQLRPALQEVSEYVATLRQFVSSLSDSAKDLSTLADTSSTAAVDALGAFVSMVDNSFAP